MKNNIIFDKIELEKILSDLPDNAVVVGQYSGSGDSGEFEEILVNDVTPDGSLRDQINSFFDEVVNENYPGWEVNDGASGTVTIDVKKRTLSIVHNEYYTESTETKSAASF